MSILVDAHFAGRNFDGSNFAEGNFAEDSFKGGISQKPISQKQFYIYFVIDQYNIIIYIVYGGIGCERNGCKIFLNLCEFYFQRFYLHSLCIIRTNMLKHKITFSFRGCKESYGDVYDCN